MNRLFRSTSFASLLALAACGGGSQTVSISISPTSANVVQGASATFSPTVSGTVNTGVSWSVKEGAAGGTIDGSGKYTASTVPGVYHVIATAEADITQTASAAVTVKPSTTTGGVSVTISPATISVAPSSTQNFTATVTGAKNTAVSWSVQEGVVGGSISQSGTYTAPATAGTFHVVATSVADATQLATSTVTVQSGVITVAVAPTPVSLVSGQTQQFEATVRPVAAGSQVNWSVQEGPVGGSVSANGLYTAGGIPGVYHVVAASVINPNSTGSATVTVSAPSAVAVKIDPPQAQVYYGQTQNFTATVTGNANTAVTWTVQDAQGGTLQATGPISATYTPPLAAQQYTATVTATSVADSSKSASVTVTVVPPPIIVTLSPDYLPLATGATASFTATVINTANTQVNWTIAEGAAGGTLSGTGSTVTYTAPSTGGDFHVVATSAADGQTHAVATVHVVPPGGYTLTGTVAYTGKNTGQIFIQVLSGGAGGQVINGTSIAAPGAFTIRGVQANGAVEVFAYMDAVGTANLNVPGDPVGHVDVQLPLTGALAAVQLKDPVVTAAPPVPTLVSLAPGNQAVVVQFSPVFNSLGEAADHYNLYWSTGPNPGPKDPKSSKQTYQAGNPIPLVLAAGSMTNGTAYNFALTAVAQGLESATSPVLPATIGSPAGGAPITGHLSFSPYLATGPLYVLAFDLFTGNLYFTVVPNPVSPQAYTLNLPDSVYEVLAWLDQDFDGEISDYDANNFSNPFFVQIQGGVVPPPGTADFSLPTGQSFGVVNTNTQQDPVGTQYGLSFAVRPIANLPVKATLMTGTDANGPIDLGIDGFSGSWVSSIQLGPKAPQVGAAATYTYSVKYIDNTTDSPVGSPSELLTSFPMATGPVNSASVDPLFSWFAPNNPPPEAVSYGIFLFDAASGQFIWYDTGIQNTAVPFASGGTLLALPTPYGLASGNPYVWVLQMTDQDGNTAVTLNSFVAY